MGPDRGIDSSINVVGMADDRWNHHGQWIYADLFYTLEYRLNYRKHRGNWYVGYEKERAYELWHDQTGHECNCTYSNLWYLKYAW